MSGFTVDVDLGNPGQLLACCGLVEAADRLWGDCAFVTGYFDNDHFHVDAPGSLHDLLVWLATARVEPRTVSATQRNEPKRKKRKSNESTSPETGQDDALRASPIILTWPDTRRAIYLDSWSAVDFGRTTIKTFAGQQTSVEMAKWLVATMVKVARTDNLDRILDYSVGRSAGDKKSFNFDQRKGRSALDLGFSIKETKIPADEFPATEILAAVGVQYYRPKEVNGALVFGVWRQPLPVELARAAAGCAFEPPGLRRFRFRLLGRKERSGVSGAPNDQYKVFTRSVEIFDQKEEDDD